MVWSLQLIQDASYENKGRKTYKYKEGKDISVSLPCPRRLFERKRQTADATATIPIPFVSEILQNHRALPKIPQIHGKDTKELYTDNVTDMYKKNYGFHMEKKKKSSLHDTSFFYILLIIIKLFKA